MLLLGVITFIPFVIKQNVGGVFILAMCLIVRKNFEFSQQKYYAIGLSLTGGNFLAYIYMWGDLANWWKYSVRFAAQQRLGDPLGPLKIIENSPYETKIVLLITLITILYQLFFKSVPLIKFSLLMFPVLILIIFLIKYLYNFFNQFSPNLDQIKLTGIG